LVWHDQALGRKAITRAFGVCATILAITIAIWPTWIPSWLLRMQDFEATWWDASIWPFGLLVWPVVLLTSQKAPLLQKMRMFSAASLLGSPYFALYHCTTMLTLTDNPLALLLSWLVVLMGRGIPDQWMKWGWLLPAGVLVIDVVSRTIASQATRRDDRRTRDTPSA